MNKTLRMISTGLIVIGLAYVFLYITSANSSGIELLKKPSYYEQENLRYIFIAGAVVIFFGIISSFFVWHKKMEVKEEILVNAGFTDKKQIESWLSGSTLDIEKKTDIKVPEVLEDEIAKTELLEGINEEATEIIGEDKTEVLSRTNLIEEKTELLTKEEK